MDFGSLLYTAHKNDKSANKEVKCYKTKFDPPKKEIKTKTNLSSNIQKYLQKREEDERRKIEEEKKKKEELLALRSQDKKAFKRVQTMLKRTKSANKSVMEDAIDEVNTVVTMAGPQQCDEDDYGYVSQEASAFYAKLMDKYASMPPEEPKFSQSKKPVVRDLNAAKDRVRAALQREEEEEMLPHKRKRKSKSDKHLDENEEEGDNEQRDRSRECSPVEEPKPKKPKKMAPPPIDFSSLLKIAQVKQFEPVQIEKKVEDDERPMTKRQKLEYEREIESRRRREEREAMRHAALNKSSKSSGGGEKREKPNSLGRIPKKSNPSSDGREKQDKINQEIAKKSSADSDDEGSQNNHHMNNGYPKNKHSSDMNRSWNEYDNRKKETSILKASLSKANDRKPLKPTQPSIASNKIKSRNHYISDEEHSEASNSGYEKSNWSSTENVKLHKYVRPIPQKSFTDTGRDNCSKKHANSDSECSDTQSGKESKKYHPSKIESHPETSNYKHKSELKYKSDRYKPSYSGKVSPRKPDYSSDRERSYSPENRSDDNNHKQSCSESEPEVENKYVLARKEVPLSKNSYSKWQNTVESDEERSQSPENSRNKKKHIDSYSKQKLQNSNQHESVKKKLLPSKQKKLSSLFEGSDGEQSPYHDKNGTHKESENRKLKNSLEANRQKCASAESKFKIPKASSQSDLERSKVSEKYERYRSAENSRPSPNSSLKQTSKEINKQQLENSKFERPNPSCKSYSNSKNKQPYSGFKGDGDSKSERSHSISKTDMDKARSSNDKIKDTGKPRSSTEPSKTDTSKENTKKSLSKNAEEVLKKSASVWSKPCNLTPTNSGPRPPNTLSESQLQRLREMNKKPTPLKPPEDRYRSSLGRPNPREERNSDGKPAPTRPGTTGVQGKQSLLMKAAAERGAMVKSQMASRTGETPSSSRPSDHKPSSKQASSSSLNKTREAPTKDSRSKLGEIKPKQFPPSDLKPKQFPPNDLKPKQFPPKDVRPRQFPPPDVRRKPKPRRIEDDSEDEYDSDMDSFIDDGSDLKQEEISEAIHAIFGYDKSRYAGLDDDDECMESNFGQIDKEELRSLRIGAREDYEELMKDLERKKRAKQRKQNERSGR